MATASGDAGNLSDIRSQIISNASALYPALTERDVSGPAKINILVRSYGVNTFALEQRLQYVAVVTANHQPIVQGAPASSLRAATASLLEATMDVMDGVGNDYFFRGGDHNADILAGGRLVWNDGEPGSVTGRPASGGGYGPDGERDPSDVPSNAASAGAPAVLEDPSQ